MIPTGIKKLDNFLDGGVKNGIITDIYGTAGTGKTLLALQISTNLISNGGQILFQDTTGEFRPERMIELMKTKGLKYNALNNVSVARITNTVDQISYLSKISKNEFSLIIIDNVTDLFVFEYSKEDQLLERSLSFMKYMKELSLFSIRNNIPIILINTVRSIDEKEHETLHRAIDIFTHMKIHLQKNNSKYSGIASLPTKNIEFEYEISSNGIIERT